MDCRVASLLAMTRQNPKTLEFGHQELVKIAANWRA